MTLNLRQQQTGSMMTTIIHHKISARALAWNPKNNQQKPLLMLWRSVKRVQWLQ